MIKEGFHRSAFTGSIQNHKIILYLFALYGFAVSVANYVVSSSYDRYSQAIVIAANYPTWLAVLSASPEGFPLHISAIIPISVAVWSSIGFAIYASVRFYKAMRTTT